MLVNRILQELHGSPRAVALVGDLLRRVPVTQLTDYQTLLVAGFARKPAKPPRMVQMMVVGDELVEVSDD